MSLEEFSNQKDDKKKGQILQKRMENIIKMAVAKVKTVH
jgi:hypothetical protein